MAHEEVLYILLRGFQSPEFVDMAGAENHLQGLI